MNATLQVLLIEDNPDDALLLLDELRRGGYQAISERVWTAPQLEEALARRPWNIIICDYALPGFNGLAALALVRRQAVDTPVILVSGVVGEEVAVEAMKAGAGDYVLKDSLVRLVPAVERELREFADRQRRQRAEQALVAAEANFRALVENSVVGIYVIQNRRFAYANPKMLEILGYSATELIARPMLEFVVEADRAAAEANLRRRLGGCSDTLEYGLRMRRKDGTIAEVEVHGTRTQFNGQPAVLGTLLDVTQRKQAEEALRQSEERFSKAFRSSPVAITLATLSEGRLIEVNEAFLAMVGYSREEVIGRTCSELGVWTDAEGQPRMAEELAKHNHARNIETSFRRRTEEEGIALGSAEVVEVSGQRCVLASFHDLTDKRRMEAQLLRNQRLESVGTLAGGIAHDLNNVLAPILLSTKLLAPKIGDAEGQSLLASIKTSAERGSTLIKQVLTFARGAEGKRLPMRVGDVVLETGSLLKRTFSKTIDVNIQVQPGLWSVLGDATQIQQVIINLAVNARDAMPTGGTLVLSVHNVPPDASLGDLDPTARSGPHIVITASDTGTGMPAQVRDRIFEPFFTTKPTGQGTGLGLSTARGLVKSHGGFITVQSQPGRGSVFRVYLPALADPVAEPPAAARPRLPRGQGELILFVDDEPGLLNLARQTLRVFGYEVVTAVNGAEAVDAFSRHRDRLALMVTDMMMPVLDGPGTIKAIRQMDSQLKIIAVSGGGAEEMPAGLEALGVSAFLAKPFTAEDFLGTVNRVLHPS